MGRAVEQAALPRGHQIVARTSRKSAPPKEELAQADVWIDFSHAECIQETVDLACDAQKPLVVGTTGWDSQRAELREQIEAAGIGVIYSPNFSLGVFFFSQLVQLAARWGKRFPQFDLAMMEWHHKHKADAPAGTAKALMATVEAAQGRAPECAVVRAGECPGQYTVWLDGPSDTVELTHRARNRDSYALGAVYAAEMIHGRKGLIPFGELLEQEWKAIL
jgi:4-hydroxy-tetrahydrodipicolinate reductase